MSVMAIRAPFRRARIRRTATAGTTAAHTATTAVIATTAVRTATTAVHRVHAAAAATEYEKNELDGNVPSSPFFRIMVIHEGVVLPIFYELCYNTLKRLQQFTQQQELAHGT